MTKRKAARILLANCLGAILALALLASPGVSAAAETWAARTLNFFETTKYDLIENTLDNGYVAYGNYIDPNGVGFVTLAKFDFRGNQLWHKKYVAGAVEGVDRTDDGGFVITASGAYGVPDPLYPGWAARLDADGNPLQEVYLGFIPRKVKVAGNACYLVGGTTEIAKLDLGTFTIDWSRGYNNTASSLSMYSIGSSTDGGLYIVGRDSVGTGILKVAPDGSLSALKSLYVPGYSIDWMRGVAPTSDNGIVLTGEVNNPADPVQDRDNVWVVKLTGTWGIAWQKAFGLLGVDYGESVSLGVDGSVFVGAQTRSWSSIGNYDMWALKLRGTNGSILWQKRYGTLDREAHPSVIATPDGGAIIRSSYMSFGATQWGSMLVKTDSNGSVFAKDANGNVIPCPCEATTTVTGVTTTGALSDETANAVSVVFEPALTPVDVPVVPENVSVTYERVCY